MASRTLYLVRHGALIADEERRYLGQMDVPLSQEGFAQAEALHAQLKDVPIARICCSDLSRSRDTAIVIAGNRNVAVMARQDLREISLGLWEGFAIRDVAAIYPKEFKARGSDIEHYRTPGGETFCECRERVIAAVQDIFAQSEGDILIVGHAGVNRLLLCEALAIPIANIFKVGQDHACLNVLDYEGTGSRVRLLNFTLHNALLDAGDSSVALKAVLAG